MNKININLGVLALTIALTTLTSCEQENDNLLQTESSSLKDQSEVLFARQGDDCQTDRTNSVAPRGTNNNDFAAKVDDRSCTYDYSQVGTYGVYRLSSSDNGRLQTRIERTTKELKFERNKTKSLTLTGTVKILNAGTTNDRLKSNDIRDTNGTYFAQVKGKHDKIISGKESRDPAIVLFVAKPKRRNGGQGSVIKTNGKVNRFDLYAEVVRRRGGSGSDPKTGRRLIFIKTVNRDSPVSVNIKTEFKNNAQYVSWNIGGGKNSVKISSLNTSGQSTKPLEARIRMGAYRCRGGKADIRWNKGINLATKN